MPKSTNGWLASSDRDAIDIEPFVINDVSFPGGVKAGAVATVLGYVAREFDERVEPLVAGWCWGHNYREIAGSTWLSNHASGTAIDINAPDHGRGARGTFTAAQVREIRKILAEANAGGVVVRWGGDYSGSAVDEMHFEIHAGGVAVEAAARRLRQQEAPEDMANVTDAEKQLMVTAAKRTMGITDQVYWARKGGEFVLDATRRQRAVYRERENVPAGCEVVPVPLLDRADGSHIVTRIADVDNKLDMVIADHGQLGDTVRQLAVSVTDLVDVVRDLAAKIDPPTTSPTK